MSPATPKTNRMWVLEFKSSRPHGAHPAGTWLATGQVAMSPVRPLTPRGYRYRDGGPEPVTVASMHIEETAP